MAVVVASVRWLQEQVRGDTPSPRHGHAVSRIGDELYLFGGCSAKSEVIQGEEKKSKQNGDNVIFYNDLYKIEITSLEWHRLTQVGDIPSKRDGHSLCTIGKHLYLFGGKDHLLSIRNLKGLYLFDPHSLNWEKCETEGPEPRSLSNTVNVLKDKIYVFGGIHRSRASNNMWMLDTNVLVWTLVETSGLPPPRRCDHASAVVKNDIYIFGGSGGERIWYNDLYIYNTENSTWSLINVQGNAPTERGCHTFTAHKDKDIYIFGGFNDNFPGVNSVFGDLCKLSLSRMKWKYPLFTGMPADRRYGHTTFIFRNTMYIMGGVNQWTHFNEMHSAKLINPSERKKSVLLMIDDITPNGKFDTMSGTSMRSTCRAPPTLRDGTLPGEWFAGGETTFSLDQSVPTLIPDGNFPLSLPGLGSSMQSHLSETQSSYDTMTTNTLPCSRGLQTMPSLLKQNEEHGDFSGAQINAVSHVTKAFEILQTRYKDIDRERELLENEKMAITKIREKIIVENNNRQKKLQKMIESQKLQNQEWLKQRTAEIEREKLETAQLRTQLEVEYQKLLQEQDNFRKRNKQLSALMKEYKSTHSDSTV